MHHITGIRQVRQGTREAEECLWRADLDLKTVWSRWEPLSLTSSSIMRDATEVDNEEKRMSRTEPLDAMT